jgi:hypothetical protein
MDDVLKQVNDGLKIVTDVVNTIQKNQENATTAPETIAPKAPAASWTDSLPPALRENWWLWLVLVVGGGYLALRRR